MTGIGSGKVLGLDIRGAAIETRAENSRVANIIGISPAARTTTVKPSGTSSIVLGCSSGVHAWHSPHYIRRMRLNKEEGLYKYLERELPALVEDDYFDPGNTGVISLPQKAPDGSIYRDEGALNLMSRALRMNQDWVSMGHNDGVNGNNCSVTISTKEEEWDEVGDFLWKSRHDYNGMTVLPYDGGSYRQAPFEECDESTYLEFESHLKAIDLKRVVEDEDHTEHTQEAACAGGVCEIN